MIVVIGLGYVGLPLAVLFSKHYSVCGFDLNKERITSLNYGEDKISGIKKDQLVNNEHLVFTSNFENIPAAKVFIITVETPVDKENVPDLTAIKKASIMIGSLINKEAVVIYESTVFPGTTEDVCIPLLEKHSGLQLNKDFSVGYSPERINPGDKLNKLESIKKITSGSSPSSAKYINDLYSRIIDAGTYSASSIKVAEAAKITENIQRDTNIALINELSIIYNLLGIDTEDVLLAAETKWNFHSYRPGLVGGHCIGVDPYYLAYKAKQLGYIPELIDTSRKLNNGMPKFISSELIKKMVINDIPIQSSKVLILGFTFKEDCSDIRNSKVHDLVESLREYKLKVDIYDPIADAICVKDAYNIVLIDEPNFDFYDAIILAVGHSFFKSLSIEKIRSYGRKNCIVYDLKYIYDKSETDIRL